MSDNWQGRPQITIFLEKDINPQEAALIYDEIRLQPSIALAEFISADQALEEFKALSGLSAEIEFLAHNPLPPSIVVMPNSEYAESSKLLRLRDELQQFDGIDQIRLDLDWTDRFNAILNTISRAAIMLSALLGVALVLIVSNTIKLHILNRRDEIEITKLVGGSNAFVRRPFLYFGALYGFFGGLFALILLILASQLIDQPLQQLSYLYGGATLLYSLNAFEIFTITSGSTLLGWLAARWAVAQHLWKINPR